MADQTRELQIIATFKDEVTNGLNKLAPTFQSLEKNLKTAGAYFVGLGVASGLAAKSIVDAAGEMQATKKAFNVLIGNADLAQKTLKDLFTLESKTPFTIQSVLTESKKLLAMGTAADDLTKTLRMLGDVAAGVGFEKLPQLTLAFGQIQAKGRLMGTELRQLTEAGFNLAEAMGVSSAKLDEMITNKEVGFEQVRAAFERVTSEGGRFNGLMDQLSQTTPGRLSTLESSIYMLKVALGDALLPAVNQLIDAVIPLTVQFSNFAANNQNLVVLLIGSGLALGALGAVMIFLVTTVTGLSAAFGVFFGSLNIVITTVSAVAAVIGGPLTIALFAVMALVGILAVAWKNNWFNIQGVTKSFVDWFSSIALPVLNANFNKISSVVQSAANTWISNFNNVRNAVNGVIGAIGSLISKAQELASRMSGGLKIPGFQHGGFVQGASNQAVPAILHGGERVIPRNGTDVNQGGQGGGGPSISVTFTGPVSMDSDSRVQELAQKILSIMGRQNELATYGISV